MANKKKIYKPKEDDGWDEQAAREHRKAIDEKTNDPSSQFYSLIIDGVDDAKVENGTISISINFVSEQMLNNDEGKIIKNKDL